MIVFAFFKRRKGPGFVPAILGPRRLVRARTILRLVPIVLTGCQSFSPIVDSQSKTQTAPTIAKEEAARGSMQKGTTMDTNDPTQKQANFQGKFSKEEQYKAHLELGQFQEGLENFEIALDEYQKALEACESHTPILGGLKSNTQQALAHRRIGAALDRLGRFEQAEVHYRTALKLHPSDPKVWNDAGYSYYLQSRWDDAERALKTADSLDPNNTRILTNLGLTLAASGKTDAALAAFTKAGGNAAGHTNLAYILAAMGKNDLALQHYRTAIEYQPEFGPAKVALAALEAKIGQSAPIAATSRPTASTTSPSTAAKPAAVTTPTRAAATTPTVTKPATPVAATTPTVPTRVTSVAATSKPVAPIPTRSPAVPPLVARPPVQKPPLASGRREGTNASKATTQAAGVAAKTPIDTDVTRSSTITLPNVPPVTLPTPVK